MPFDGANLPSIDALNKLDAVMDLIGDEKRWCKSALVNSQGQMCLLGALRSIGSDALLKPHILHAVLEVTGAKFRTIESFNDHRSTDHSVVLQVLRRTRENIVMGHSPMTGCGASLYEGWQAQLRGWCYRLCLTVRR